MAKKKGKTKKEEEDFDDFEDDSFGEEEIESHYPKLEGKEVKKSKPKDDLEEEIEAEEEEEFELEPEIEVPEYKHIGLDIKYGLNENDYKIIIKGQSHGFCNIFVKHLLNIEGVNIASYKITKLEHPEIFVRIENGYKIKDVLFKGIEALKKEVSEVQSVFKKLM
ncbi:MAG: RpoL/Rpb11 RNA polymerase subunit family protein [Candidatus Thorarchaeota archaeon]